MEYRDRNMRFELSFWGGTINIYKGSKKVDEIELSDYQKSEIKEEEKSKKKYYSSEYRYKFNSTFNGICSQWMLDNLDIIDDL